MHLCISLCLCLSRPQVFHRFQSEAEATSLAEGVGLVRRLKKQIEAFKQYRRLGIRTLEQARAFEADRKRREHQVRYDASALTVCVTLLRLWLFWSSGF